MMFYRNFFGCQPAVFWSPWNIIMMIFFIILITVIAVVLFKKAKRSDANNALDELKIRFVRGEITKEEYLKQKAVLSDT